MYSCVIFICNIHAGNTIKTSCSNILQPIHTTKYYGVLSSIYLILEEYNRNNFNIPISFMPSEHIDTHTRSFVKMSKDNLYPCSTF